MYRGVLYINTERRHAGCTAQHSRQSGMTLCGGSIELRRSECRNHIRCENHATPVRRDERHAASRAKHFVAPNDGAPRERAKTIIPCQTQTPDLLRVMSGLGIAPVDTERMGR
ncbi:conserved hypothetical protein [Ricinus communis]|uniref:Uncharacterized protein n=1 Tax=Ricinus communis TaxID=3988 RepID=B9TDU9_RICCO|nr:conserved hypothetical protein [Ricinus communis]